MKANEFIKKYGVNIVKESLKLSGIDTDFNRELKRLIASHDLVISYGGLRDAKGFIAYSICEDEKINKLEQAIADVESCQ